MWSSIVRVSDQLDPRCNQQTSRLTTAPISYTRLSPRITLSSAPLATGSTIAKDAFLFALLEQTRIRLLVLVCQFTRTRIIFVDANPNPNPIPNLKTLPLRLTLAVNLGAVN